MVLMLCASVGWSATPSAVPALTMIQGEVLEVREVESYTYLRLKTRAGEIWAAVAKVSVKKGVSVVVENAQQMNNFESKSLKKTFPVIFFGNLAQPKLSNTESAAQMASARASSPKAEAVLDAKVSKATGPDAHTVAELVAKVSDLKDKTVVLHAKVVKYNPGIMGKNWAHLRDGSGSAADNTHDILVTTQEPVKVGDVVTFKGMLRKDKDFGSGYMYQVLIEEAKLQK